MTEIRDRVTYAIMRAFFSRPVEEQYFNASPADNEDLALAAIAALREPTEAMLFVGSNDEAGFTAINLRESWYLMIDEILK